MYKLILALLLLIALCGSACSTSDVNKHNTFEACVSRGNKVLKTYPPRCVDEQGRQIVKSNLSLK